MKKVIKSGPGVLIGIRAEAIKGESAKLYDDGKLIVEIELDNIPSELEFEPIFFKRNLSIEGPEHIEVLVN